MSLQVLYKMNTSVTNLILARTGPTTCIQTSPITDIVFFKNEAGLKVRVLEPSY